jgi:LemA protein
MELIVILAIVVVVVLILVGIYNGLVTRRNRIDEALGQIEVQLKRSRATWASSSPC